MCLSLLNWCFHHSRRLAVHVRGRLQTHAAPSDGDAGIGKTCTQVHSLTCRFGLIGRRQREIECRSRPRRRLHPHSAAVPLDGPLAVCETQSVPGVFLSVQALKHAEDTFLKYRVYTDRKSTRLNSSHL